MSDLGGIHALLQCTVAVAIPFHIDEKEAENDQSAARSSTKGADTAYFLMLLATPPE